MSLERYDLVCLGAGVAAGYWAEEIVSLVKGIGLSDAGPRPRVCIISAYPDGLAPYERSELSKDCLRPSLTHSRDWQAWGNRTFPYTSSASRRDARSFRWYRDKGVTILPWCECYRIDVTAGMLLLLQYSERSRTRSKAKNLEIVYGSLLVATGSSPRRLDGDTGSSPCFCLKHLDLRGVRLDKPDTYGLGSAHYLRDIGDCIKLVKALGTAPASGAGGNGRKGGDANTVALVGGGVLCMEVAATIVSHYTGIRPILLVAGSRLMPNIFNQEISDFYEGRLADAGVTVVRNVRAERLWGLEEQGEFETLGGEKVHFGPAPRGYTECRGVVVRGREDQTIHVPARVVLIGIGSVPNSDIFRGQLEMSPNGGVCVDRRCRAIPKVEMEDSGAVYRPVFAAGDVASFPLGLEPSRRIRLEHAQNARDMAVVSARNMVHAMGFSERSGMGGLALGNGGSASDISVNDSRAHDPVPSFSSKFLGLSWRFYGVAEGEVVVMGRNQFPITRTFGAFWVRAERVVGAFLEGGTLEQQITVAQVTRLRPKVFSAKVLQESRLGDFLADPGSIEASDDSDLSQLLMCCRCV